MPSSRSRPFWLPSLFFWITLGLSGLLLALVGLSPWVESFGSSFHGGSRLLELFARDVTLRRTAIASALGLTVTAYVFFRPTGAGVSVIKRSKPPKSPPPPRIVGA